jgi:predicted O-methyltransferase YrrM
MKVWDDVDRYITETLVQPDAALKAALAAAEHAGLPPISVSPAHGKLLFLLALTVGAKRILEIGTLGGYSAIWLARALPPGGELITLEAVEKHAAVARKNIERSGLSAVVDVRVGQALDTLPRLEGPFDLTFIHADKQNNAEYFRWALKLSRPGSLIVVDNVVREGAVVDADSRNAAVLGVRRLYELMAKEPRVAATAIQTVGVKGYDGFAIAQVLS